MFKVVSCEWCGQVFDLPIRKKSATCSVLCRFSLKVQRDAAPGACREWQAFRNPLGYGMFRVEIAQSMRLAHRVAWELFVGAIPDGLHALHRCDNPSCVNVAHLFLGTNADNVADKIAKGRHGCPSGPGHWAASGCLRGRIAVDGFTTAKLTDAERDQVRSMVASGVGRTAVASAFGVHPITVRRICG